MTTLAHRVARAFDPGQVLGANGYLLTGQCNTTAMRFPVLVKKYFDGDGRAPVKRIVITA